MLHCWYVCFGTVWKTFTISMISEIILQAPKFQIEKYTVNGSHIFKMPTIRPNSHRHKLRLWNPAVWIVLLSFYKILVYARV